MNKYIENVLKHFDDEFRKRKKFRIEFVPDLNEPYIFNIGKPVEISIGGPSFYGIYRGLRNNEEELVLYPFVMGQTFPESVITDSKNSRAINICKWSDRPALIIRERISMLPMDAEYLFRRVEQARELERPGIILPEQVSNEQWKKMAKKFKEESRK